MEGAVVRFEYEASQCLRGECMRVRWSGERRLTWVDNAVGRQCLWIVSSWWRVLGGKMMRLTALGRGSSGILAIIDSWRPR